MIAIRIHDIKLLNEIHKISVLKQVKNFKDDTKEYLNVSPAKQPYSILMLKEPIEVTGLYWIKRRTDKIAFCVDDFTTIEKIFKGT